LSEIVESVLGSPFQARIFTCVNGRMRAALAGGMAAALWGVQEPRDKRLFRCDYSDVAVLGKAARGESGVPRLLTNARAFGQATWRHAPFGAVLGRLA